MTFALIFLTALSASAHSVDLSADLDVQAHESRVEDASTGEQRAWLMRVLDRLFGLGEAEAASADAVAPAPVEAALATVRTDAAPDRSAGPLKRFAGFDQAWHNRHDAMIGRVVAEFNAEKGWTSGHPSRLDPDLVKAWALQESGGHREIFSNGDMMQMNNRGDWAPEKQWFGLQKGQRIDPERSLRIALRWAYYKAEETRVTKDGKISPGWHATQRGTKRFVGYQSRFTTWQRALSRYNGGGVADYYGDIQRKMRRSHSA